MAVPVHVFDEDNMISTLYADFLHGLACPRAGRLQESDVDKYEQLRQILDRHIAGAPKNPAFDEILRILFSPEEVDVALGLKFAPRTVAAVSRASGVVEEKAAELLEAMAGRGVVFSREKNGAMGYALLPTVPGLFEFPFMAGGGTAVHDRLAKLWSAYHEEALGNAFAGSQTPFVRIIPVEKDLNAVNRVAPYEELSGMLEGCRDFAVAHCACRLSVNKCDAPREVCLIFDQGARFLVSRGLAKPINKQDAQRILLEAEEAGLVHSTSNSQDRLNFVCNCCSCCCTILRGWTELKNPNAFAKSRFRAKVDPGACSACGICADERCPMEAIELTEEAAEVFPDRCIGCGVCATACPERAITMELLEQAAAPPKTMGEMGLAVATEKGKLEEFLKMMDPGE